MLVTALYVYTNIVVPRASIDGTQVLWFIMLKQTRDQISLYRMSRSP